MKIKNLLKNTKFLLSLIVLFGVILRLSFFSGMSPSDSLFYSEAANNLEKITAPDSTHTLTTRMGLVYATAFSYKLFGVNEFSSVLFVLLTSIGNIILAFYFGSLLFNKKTGLMASFLLSFFPLDVVYSTKLISDIPSAFFMALGVYLFLHSEIKSKIKMSYLFSGIFIGIGYLIRESVLLIALFFIIYIIYKRKLKLEYFLVPLGVILIFAFEFLYFFISTGNALFRSTASQKILVEAMQLHNYYGRLDFPTGLFHYPYIILTTNMLVFFYIAIGLAIAYFWINKKKDTILPQIWFISLLLYLSFGSASLTSYIPVRAVDRYLTIITIPGMLLLAYFLTDKKAIIRKYIVPLVLTILLVTSIFSIYIREDRNRLKTLKEANIYLKDLDRAIYIDDRSLMALSYINQYEEILDIKEYPDSLVQLKDAYIVINKDMIKNLIAANKNRIFPKEIDNPPENWIIIREFGEKDKIIVYYAQ